MDFKFRLQHNQYTNRQTIQNPNTNTSDNSSGWDRYARKNIPNHPTNLYTNTKPLSNNSMKQKTLASSSAHISSRQSINRYYRSDAAPKNQFKHYLSDISNVFFQQRYSLKQIKLYESIKWITAIIWILMLIIFVSLSFIHPFEGQCPNHAQCGVFVHCSPGFKYNLQNKQCVLSADLYDQIEQVCINMLEKAREDWGDAECNEQIETIPRINLGDLVIGIQNMELKRQLLEKLEIFLNDRDNQQFLEFDYFPSSRTIMPNTKKYTLACKIKKLSTSINFKIVFPLSILIIGVLFYIQKCIKNRIIANKIYKQLRKRTQQQKQKLLNISNTKSQMQKQYGPINEELWKLIDQLRSKDRDIGFLQDDFLYWKML